MLEDRSRPRHALPLRVAQRRAREVGPRDGRAGEVGARQVGALEVLAREVHPGEVAAGQVGRDVGVLDAPLVPARRARGASSAQDLPSSGIVTARRAGARYNPEDEHRRHDSRRRSEPGDGAHPQGVARRPPADLRHELGGDARRTAGAAPGEDCSTARRARTASGPWSTVSSSTARRCPTRTTPSRPSTRSSRRPGTGFFLMKDLPASGSPEIVRRLRDPYRALKDRGRHVLIVSPRLVDPGRPEEGDLRRRVRAARRQRDPRSSSMATCGAGSPSRSASPPMRRLSLAMRGPDGRRDRARRLESLLARQVLRRGRLPRGPRPRRSRCRARKASSSSSRRASRSTTSAVSTMLKTWLQKRQALFSKDALDAGMPSRRASC